MKLTNETLDKFEADGNKLAVYQKGDSMAGAVLLFMSAFNQPPCHADSDITSADFTLAMKLMAEEISEMWEGFNKFENAKTLENKTEFVDGAIDAIYVILWTLLKFGVPVQQCFDEVQRSNMAKLQSDGSFVKTEFGKVKKPASWTPPDLFGILKDHSEKGLYRNGFAYHGK